MFPRGELITLKGGKWLSFRIGLMLPLVEFWLRRTSFKRCQRDLARLARWLPPYAARKISVAEAQALARTVEYGNAHYSIYPADCLTRSLVLQYLLTRRGGEAQLCLGVRKLTGQFEAHAWVEVEGVPLNELETVREIYTALDLTAAKDRAGA